MAVVVLILSKIMGSCCQGRLSGQKMKINSGGTTSTVCRAIVIAFGISLLALSVQAQAFTRGSFAVTAGGGASYDIPLVIPQGVAGLTPRLALSYSSQGGSGLLGRGWALLGLSSIRRCAKSKAADGSGEPIGYVVADGLCIDGQRMQLISGSQGVAGSEYRTDSETFSRIVASGVAGNGPASFLVTLRSGGTQEYGVTSDARIEAEGKTTIAVWALNKISDTLGNSIAFSYNKSAPSSSFDVNDIKYGSGTSQTKVSFVYAQKAANDIRIGYLAGSKVVSDRRLERVNISQANVLQRSYVVTYATPAGEESVVEGIMECAYDSSGSSCLSPISFEYFQTMHTGFDVKSAFPNTGYGVSANNYKYLAGDFNGDGKTDLIHFASNRYVHVWNSRGDGGFDILAAFPNNGYGVDSNNYKFQVGDFNGDGRSDLVHFANNRYVHVWLSNGNGTFDIRGGFPNNGYGVDANDYKFQTGDFNGDGRTDLIHFANSNYVHVWLSNGDGTFTITSGFPNSGYGVGANAYNYQTGDFNGDGKTDLVHFANSNYIHLWLSKGDGTFAILSRFPSTDGYIVGANGYKFSAADFNGDGLTDLIHFVNNDYIHVWLSRGDGTFDIHSKFPSSAGYGVGANNYSYQVGDFNGDGRADLMHFADFNYTHVWLSRGDGAFDILTRFPGVNGYGVGANSFNFVGGDFNGDGRSDFIHLANESYVHAWLSTPTFAYGGVSKISNANLTTVMPSYAALSVFDRYHRTISSGYPVLSVMAPAYVVSEVKTNDGVGGLSTIKYSYSNMLTEVGLLGRGGLGFAWTQTEIVNSSSNLKSRTYYRQDFPFIGMVDKSTQGFGGSVDNLSQTTYEYGCYDFDGTAGCQVGAGKRYFPYLSKMVETAKDPSGKALPGKRTETTYKECSVPPFKCFGNATQVKITTLNPDGTDSGYVKTTDSEFYNDETNWILGRLLRSKVTSTTP
jgi:FG-GAP-like repeat/Salmonella virulence plasmid 65kDa B protein